MVAVLEKLGKIGIVPVIKIDDPEKAVPLARALLAGGIPCAEITFRTSQGEAALGRISREVPEILLGAGTVLTVEQVDKAIAAGAKFIVSPGFNPRVVQHCIDQGIPITPGCSNPSDMEAALEAGLEVVKFFPAEQSGGLDYIKAVAAPYTTLKFMPTGGINALNIAAYTSYEKILACGGSWMVPADRINAGDFDTITALCKEAVSKILGFSLVHVGINAANENEALKAARLFETMFGFTAKSGTSSIFSGEGIEIMKSPYLGKNGHIAIGTNSLKRGIAYLERKGFTFNPDSLKTDARGVMAALYLSDEIAGFAVHLVQKK
ncbi:MAG: bifunctional 4-hydroxy-2-oxoglutarate aldolase/2-dehydro-3-deoxy-phosphogluconate aldolase [Spirochaetaceae bacterium]|jgi:2-dehydro-3-deoxyphosphogluconate aldolase/(4S)-4-hydroxy-2-oxoglutarate aldolase|nr:bifunctional 4-hydroxy-2-oxoglutarate aldolase/2-dehydro-3-deoxy-phosphogluconate aldolase [Spirochaetaceae bacterium]